MSTRVPLNCPACGREISVEGRAAGACTYNSCVMGPSPRAPVAESSQSSVPAWGGRGGGRAQSAECRVDHRKLQFSGFELAHPRPTTACSTGHGYCWSGVILVVYCVVRFACGKITTTILKNNRVDAAVNHCLRIDHWLESVARDASTRTNAHARGVAGAHKTPDRCLCTD